jgi:hypothetical protein
MRVANIFLKAASQLGAIDRVVQATDKGLSERAKAGVVFSLHLELGHLEEKERSGAFSRLEQALRAAGHHPAQAVLDPLTHGAVFTFTLGGEND